MLLKISSKEFKKNVENYIKDRFNDWYEYEKDWVNEKYIPGLETGGYSFIKDFIIRCFVNEKLGYNIHGQDLLKYWYKDNLYNAFEDWMSGLPSVIDGEYYLHSAINYISKLRGASESEDYKKIEDMFDETRAEQYMTELLYKELFKNISIYDIKSMYRDEKPFKRI